MIDISEIESRLQRATTRAEKARTALAAATAEVSRLETALSVVRELMGSGASTTSTTTGLTPRQQHVVNALKYGQNNAMSPVDTYHVAAATSEFDGDVNYVRTTLWRMADKGQIGSANGTYWRFAEMNAVLDPATAELKMANSPSASHLPDWLQSAPANATDSELPSQTPSSSWEDDDADCPF